MQSHGFPAPGARSAFAAVIALAFAFMIPSTRAEEPGAPAAPKPANTDSAANPAKPVTDIRIVIQTSQGNIEATLFASKVPMTAANFLNLAKKGFYDGILFHRVIPNFMVQVGDPQTKQPGSQERWGTGGPGYRFADEIDPSLKHSKPGMLSMANAGPNTNGSQIFITHLPTPHLDGKHAVFGEVTKGQEVVDKVKQGDKILKIEVLDPTDALFTAQADNLAKWNAQLKL